MEALIFDTTFLIDFQRERSGSRGGAHAFLQDHAEAVAYLPMTAYGEFAEGFPNRTDATFLSVVESFELLSVTRAVALVDTSPVHLEFAFYQVVEWLPPWWSVGGLSGWRGPFPDDIGGTARRRSF